MAAKKFIKPKRNYLTQEAMDYMRSQLSSMGEAARNSKGRNTEIAEKTKRAFPECKYVSMSAYYRWLKVMRQELNQTVDSKPIDAAKPVTRDKVSLATYADIISLCTKVLVAAGNEASLRAIAEDMVSIAAECE